MPNLAFIQSAVHDELVDQARIGFESEIGDSAQVQYFSVPGAFELPLRCQDLAATGEFDALIAAGFVVDGGIYRHEFVATAVISGLMDVQLRTNVAVFSCVLTPQSFHESSEHFEFFHSHMRVKGVEVAQACLQTLDGRLALLG